MNQAQASTRQIGFWSALRIWWTDNISPLQMATLQLQRAEVSLLDHEANREVYTAECEMLKARIKRLRKQVNDLTMEQVNGLTMEQIEVAKTTSSEVNE